MPEEQQVVVAGAGPTGLVTALGLAQQGVHVTVVERSPGLQDAPRAVVYHWSTLDGLERLGLFDEASRAGFVKQDYAYRVRKTGEVVSYGLKALEGRVRHPYNLHLGQGALAQVVLARLQDHPHVEFLWDTEVVDVAQDEAGVGVTLRGGSGETTVRARWVVGADGASSRVRGALDVGFDGMTWPERFVATNIRFPDDREGWAQSTFYVDDEYRVQRVPDMFASRFRSPFTEDHIAGLPFNAAAAAILIAPQLGLGRHALELTRTKLLAKPVAYTAYSRAQDSPTHQLGVAKAATKLHLAELLTAQMCRDIDGASTTRTQPSPETLARLRNDTGVVAELVREEIDLLLTANGAGSFADANVLSRIWRDAETAGRHALVTTEIGREAYGRLLLGNDQTTVAL